MAACMRRDFLSVLINLMNKTVNLVMFETTLPSIKAIYRSSDSEFAHAAVSNLQSPIGVVPEAIVRISDCIALEFEFNLEES